MENVNDIFADFAAAFIGRLRGDGDVVHPERLKRDQLNYSPLRYIRDGSEHSVHYYANVQVQVQE